MQNRTNLGMSIGQMLSSGLGGGNAYEQGQMAGADIAYRRAAANKMNAEAEAENAGIAARSDGSLKKTLLAGIGADSEDGLRDLDAALSGTYQPPTQPLAFIDGGKELPAPEYVSKFPELQNRYSTLKQMLALGDKDITHLPKTIQGDQRNRLTSGLENATPQQAAEIGMRASALEGNVNPLEMQKAAILYGLVNGNNGVDNQNALLLSQGKTRYDNMGGTGTFDLLTGLSKINPDSAKVSDKWQYDTSRGLRVNPSTGVAEPINFNGEPIKPKNDREIKLEKGEMEMPDGSIRAVEGSNLYIKQSGQHGKEIDSLNGLSLSTKNAINKIDTILDPKNEDAFMNNFGGYNASISNMFPGATQDVKKNIESLKSDLKMAGLNTIRAGGSIGAMTEKEWPIVEGMIASITPQLSEDEAKYQLLKVKAYLESIEKKANDTYDEVWGNTQYYKGRRGGGGSPQPSDADKAAIAWARANPNDARAKQILKANGL